MSGRKFLRESSGSNIAKTLLKAVKVLALFRIPHYICGGFAVQEHGYPRLRWTWTSSCPMWSFVGRSWG